MAGIFENYRCKHHPDATRRLELATACLKDDMDFAAAIKILRARDRELWLEMESSSLAGILIEPMVEACPGKKFILTIRDVYSWCDSWLDHNINSPPDPSSRFAALDRVRLRVDSFAPTPHDSPLVQRGFPPLACFFQLWTNHNRRILETVPEHRLLIVKTPQIIDRIPELAEWLGIPPETLREDRGWLDAAPQKHGVLATLDASYVRETARRLCGTLMDQYFPEVGYGADLR